MGAEGAQQCFTKGIRPPKAAGEMPTEETPPCFGADPNKGGFLLWNYTDVVMIEFGTVNCRHSRQKWSLSSELLALVA